MAIERLTFSNDLKAKELSYCDEFFSLKGEKITPSDSFSYNCYEALRDINDFKTNNYSNLFLTKKQKNSDWLNINTRESNNVNGFVTTFEWKDKDNKSWWLYFDDNYNIKDRGIQEIGCKVVDEKSEKLYRNHIFYLEFLNDVQCHICHIFGDMTLYLTEEGGNLSFKKGTNSALNTFNYQIDGNKMKLYNTKGEVLSLVVEKDVTNLLFNNDTTSIKTCNIQNDLLNFDYYIDGSWVSYNRNNFVTSIDKNRSAQELKTQALIHHQYNREDGFNFIPLKNNLTYKGNSVRGNNTNYSDDDYPDVDYRTYTAIHSGLNQEKGKENITLSFTFTDQEYEVNGGQTLTFSIKERDENGLPTLFPYEYININDTKFVKNGAFASSVPFFSDKIKMKQDGGILNQENGKSIPNNATYLCTWLYKKDNDSSPVWLDRYYYPDYKSRNEVLIGDYYSQSFENYIDKHLLKNTSVEDVKKKIHQETYFDTVSDMVIKENGTYHYQRVSEKMVNEVLNNIENYRIPNITSNTNKTIDLLNQFQFDGKQYGKLKYNQWNKTNVINLNTDIYLSRKKKMGIQLFGTDYNHGFNIQNRKDLVPFHYYPAEKILYLLNNKFEIVHQFDFGSKYANEKINKLILGEVFDDVIVVGNSHLYIFSYDLQLKHKLHTSNDIFTNGLNLKTDKAVLFENNIYVPYNSGILKVVMLPNERDLEKLTTWDRESKTVALRLLDADEYQKGFQSGDVKNIYIDEDGTIYALDFEKYAMCIDRETLHGLQKNGSEYQIVQQSLAKLYGGIDNSKYQEFRSLDSIDLIRFNQEGEMCLIRNFSNSTDRKRLQVFDKTKQMIFEYDMSGYEKVLSLDAYTFIDEKQEEQVCFTVLCSIGTMIQRLTYLSKNRSLTYSTLSIPEVEIIEKDTDGNNKTKIIPPYPYGDENAIFETVNSNRSMSYEDNNALFFNLHVPSQYIYDNKATIKWSLDDIQDGWYNINIYINLDEAIFDVKINDLTLEIIKNQTHYKTKNGVLIENGKIEWFLPHVSSDGSVFNTTYYLGILGKKYGTLLNKVLKNGIEDPYVCVNSKIENMQIHTKELKYHELQAMRMRGKKINKLILTLPCGNRNCIDEMIRYFKYVATQSISNSIKINVAGTGLQTEGQFNLLKKEIMAALENNKDCLIKIRDIEFIDNV